MKLATYSGCHYGIVLWGVVLFAALCITATAAPNAVQINNSSGWQIASEMEGYHYGPTIIINSDNSIDMWCTVPGYYSTNSEAWDAIAYRRSTDGGHTWTPDAVVLQPTPESPDRYSNADPGVIKIGSYYYLAYGATDCQIGSGCGYAQCFVARSTSPGGPYEKWNGSGWGGIPQPIITYSGNPAMYGIGEPSLVLQDGKLYIFYTYADPVWYTDLAICDNPNDPNWPANLELKGHVVAHIGEDSMDVKYCDSLNRFISVSTFERMTPNATVLVRQSEDGINWEIASFRGDRTQCGNHNIGISGDASGHIDLSKSNFIAYAYQPPMTGWGIWPTYFDPITVSTVDFGKPVYVTATSVRESASYMGNEDWAWSRPRAIDGKATTAWSGAVRASANTQEWAAVYIGDVFRVSGVQITPDSGGAGFPVDFKIQYMDYGSQWVDVPGQVYNNYPNPGGSVQTFNFALPVVASHIRILATELAGNPVQGYDMRIAEISPMIAGKATAYDAASEFSNVNPSGDWKYLWKIGIPPAVVDVDVFNQYDDFGNGMVRWVRVDSGWWRGDVWKNTSADPVDFVSSWFQPGKIALDPGTGHAPLDFWPSSAIRWTAPYAGAFKIDSTFSGVSYANSSGVTADAYVWKNGAALWGGQVRGFVGGGSHAAITPDTAVKSYSTYVQVQPGDTIDFSVWCTGNNNFGDTTQLDAIITPTARGRVQGVVNSDLPGYPALAGARVWTTDGYYSTTTASDGSYSFDVLPGNYEINVDLGGYGAESASVDVEAGEVVVQGFTLTADKVFNASDDYGQFNPNGVWNYMWKIGIPPVVQDVADLNQFDNFGAITRWTRIDEGWWRGDVGKNVSGAPLNYTEWGIWLDTDDLYLCPGTQSDPIQFYPWSSLRWTAPCDGLVSINATFTGRNYQEYDGTTTDAYVFKNGTALFGQQVRGFVGGGGINPITPETATRNYNGSFNVKKGDKIDFAAWCTGNGNGGDVTGLDALITMSYGRFNGHVKSDLPGNPALANAEVQTLDGAYRVLTGADGGFDMTLPPGNYTFVVNCGGYESQQLSFNLNDNQLESREIVLAHKTSFNLAEDFNNINPNGVWKYLWQIGTPPVVADVDLFNQFDDFGNGAVRWVRIDQPGSWWRGDVWKYSGVSNLDFISCIFTPGSAALDPGTAVNGFYPSAVVRWTAPFDAEKLSINAVFKGICYAGTGTSTDVFVRKNGVQLWSGAVRGFVGGSGHPAITPETATRTYDNTISVVKGDVIDFAVWCTENLHGSDTTSLDLIIAVDNIVEAAHISSLKDLEDGTQVAITEAQVAGAAFNTFTDGSYYIQDEDRSAGIKVKPGAVIDSVSLNQKITLTGIMRTDTNGERYIELKTIERFVAQAADPLGIIGKTVLPQNLDAYGLLVRIWGKVTYVEPTTPPQKPGYAYVDDGSGLLDASGNPGIRVILNGLNAPITKDLTGRTVGITGLLGLAKEGGTTIPAIRPRGDSDIELY